ncbi:MAG: YlmC/YmxH family sporulation protein [Clostridia bacterium]
MFEKTTYGELRQKEVINVCDGARLGLVCDLELDICAGTVLAIIVPGPSRCFGLIHSSEELVIPFCKLKKIGEDVILVEINT